MAIYVVASDQLKDVGETTFGNEGLFERRDLQRLLRQRIGILGEGLLVVAEEFGDWLDSKRRIDLLCLDADANLVVVELKRADESHMELQALRYAAMVSSMTFDQLVDTFARYRNRAQPDVDSSRAAILDFLHWTEVDEDDFAQDTRIILASPDFGKELTTAVLWLRERGLDIRCHRLKLYRMEDGQLLLDVDQTIPLPEAAEFQTQIGFKKQAERKSRTDRQDLRLKFWQELLDFARTRSDLFANRKATSGGWIATGIGRAGFALIYTVRQTDSQVELWIGLGPGSAAKNKAAFHALKQQQSAIETEFGGSLEWQELPEGDGCRVRYVIEGGYRTPMDEWPAIHERLVSAMVRLDKTVRSRVAKLVF